MQLVVRKTQTAGTDLPYGALGVVPTPIAKSVNTHE